MQFKNGIDGSKTTRFKIPASILFILVVVAIFSFNVFFMGWQIHIESDQLGDMDTDITKNFGGIFGFRTSDEIHDSTSEPIKEPHQFVWKSSVGNNLVFKKMQDNWAEFHDGKRRFIFEETEVDKEKQTVLLTDKARNFQIRLQGTQSLLSKGTGEDFDMLYGGSWEGALPLHLF